MTEENRQVLDVDVLFVGAGSASLAGALHLKKLAVNAGLDISIAIRCNPNRNPSRNRLTVTTPLTLT